MTNCRLRGKERRYLRGLGTRAASDRVLGQRGPFRFRYPLAQRSLRQ